MRTDVTRVIVSKNAGQWEYRPFVQQTSVYCTALSMCTQPGPRQLSVCSSLAETPVCSVQSLMHFTDKPLKCGVTVGILTLEKRPLNTSMCLCAVEKLQPYIARNRTWTIIMVSFFYLFKADLRLLSTLWYLPSSLQEHWNTQRCLSTEYFRGLEAELLYLKCNICSWWSVTINNNVCRRIAEILNSWPNTSTASL